MSNSVRTISGVSTSVTAFVGAGQHGPTDRPVAISDFDAFEQAFGGLHPDYPLTYAVWHFFANGGREALVCRVPGDAINDEDVSSPELQAAGEGLWLLEQAPYFNILCIPPLGPDRDVGRATWDVAAEYARRRRAMLLVDPAAAWRVPSDITPGALEAVISDGGPRANAAIYYPRVLAADPTRDSQLVPFAPCGAVAGVYARTDAQAGVWKPPAGRAATLAGIDGLTVELTDNQNGELNTSAINCIRRLPGLGTVIWGARTLHGQDALASDWKYVPVRRTALYLEQSIHRGSEWAVFEPNDERLWAELRRSIASFMHELFRRGAFQGQTPNDAYLVKCDSETTTRTDVKRGVLNIVVGFAPLKPAEFVVIRIQHVYDKP